MHFYSQINPITITPFTVESTSHYSQTSENGGILDKQMRRLL